MTDSLQDRVRTALARVRNSRVGADILSADLVRDIALTTSGRVRLTLLLSPEDDATLVRDVYAALSAVEGITDVRVDPRDPREFESAPSGARAGMAPSASASGAPGAGPSGHQHAAPSSGGQTTASSGAHATAPNARATAPNARATAPNARTTAPGDHAAAPARRMLPVMDAAPKAPARPAAPTPSAFPTLGRIIAVSSGKGGVGKSTIAVNIAVALARAGARVGLMDADIYGPNVPRMLGVSTPPPVIDQRIIPLVAHGIKTISLGLLIPRDQPAIWRGPIVMKVIGQFLKDVEWGQLDYLIVDMPPGTGDAQLSLVQSAHVAGAVIVTTPQDVAAGDALRGVKMFERVNVPVLGIVENMSYFECPHCGKPTPIFGEGGGERLADEVGLPLLGRIPLDPRIVAGGDTGAPIVITAPDSSAALGLTALAARVADAVHAAVPA